MKEYKILIIDDEEVNRRLYYDDFSREGYDVKTASSGKIGLQLIADFCPDVLLLDLMLPDMSGYEIYNKLKNNLSTNHIHIIFITAYFNKFEVINKIENLSKDDVFQKPFNTWKLKKRVATLLGISYDEIKWKGYSALYCSF